MKHHESHTIKTDILIIGGGGAAAMAALSAAKLGSRVTIVSKETSFVGGATIQSSGGISVLSDSNDSPEAFFKDVMAGGANLNNPKLVGILAEHAASGLLKLEEYDFPLDRDDPQNFHMVKGSEGHTCPRGYLDRRESMGFCHALERALLTREIVFYPEVFIETLLLNDGRVVGALGFNLPTGVYMVFNAKAVILATGGLGQIYEMTTNSRTLTGDGYALAWEAGASLVDMEMIQFMPLSFPRPRSWRGVFIGMCSLWGPNVKLFNGLGERYMEKYDRQRMEYTTRDIAARANFTEIMQGRGTEFDAIVVDPTENDPALLPRYRNSLPHIYSRVGKVFGSQAANWQQSFQAVPSQHYTMGGVVVDEHLQTEVPGMFAVGEVIGGVHGANRLSGTALTEILVFGNLAGVKVTQWIRGKRLVPPDERDLLREKERLGELFKAKAGPEVRPFEIKRAVQRLMWKHLGPVRNGPGIKTAVDALRDIQQRELLRMQPASNHRVYNRERVEVCEARFMAKVAFLAARAALTREESRGSHYRIDFPIQNDSKWLKNILLTKTPAGEVGVALRKQAKN